MIDVSPLFDGSLDLDYAGFLILHRERDGDEAMKKSPNTEQQFTCALKRVESETPVADMCLQPGASEASFYVRRLRLV